jgi:hypothetical protein
MTDPERLVWLALIVAGSLQLAKMFIPLLNGWVGVVANAVLTAVALFTVFRFELTWTMVASYMLVGLAAAGIHGTVTKVSDYPSPHHNPTPSGTPAQNHSVHIDN